MIRAGAEVRWWRWPWTSRRWSRRARTSAAGRPAGASGEERPERDGRGRCNRHELPGRQGPRSARRRRARSPDFTKNYEMDKTTTRTEKPVARVTKMSVVALLVDRDSRQQKSALEGQTSIATRLNEPTPVGIDETRAAASRGHLGAVRAGRARHRRRQPAAGRGAGQEGPEPGDAHRRRRGRPAGAGRAAGALPRRQEEGASTPTPRSPMVDQALADIGTLGYRRHRRATPPGSGLRQRAVELGNKDIINLTVIFER
ncbi:MAG: flagellar M-ring protein FliF C-terminal domain-containing protein [Myxococcota bacterium]